MTLTGRLLGDNSLLPSHLLIVLSVPNCSTMFNTAEYQTRPNLTSGYFDVLLGTLRYIWVLWGTLRYFEVLWGTMRYLLILWGISGYFWYFEVLLGTLSYFWVLWGTYGYFQVLLLPSSPFQYWSRPDQKCTCKKSTWVTILPFYAIQSSTKLSKKCQQCDRPLHNAYIFK